MALGDLAFKETGKFSGKGHSKTEKWKRPIRELANCSVQTIQLSTGFATPYGGSLIGEFNGICTTKDGDIVGVWADGRADLPEVA